MAFTNQNDVNILQASDLAVIGAGAGDDRYIVTAATLTAGKSIQISDTQGANTLQLVGGLAITSSIVGANGVLLTLNNGATIEVLGAANFSFITGGDPLSGTGGTTQTFSQFVTQSLGIAAVPTGNATANGAAVTVNANGGTTAGGGGNPNPGVPGQTFDLTAGVDNRTGTANNDTFDGSINANTQTPNTLNSFDTVAGGLGFDRIIVAQNIADTDFLNTSGVESVTTNGNVGNAGVTPSATQVTLANLAQTAGITEVNSSARNTTVQFLQGYTNDQVRASLISQVGVNNTAAVNNNANTANTVILDNQATGTNLRLTFASAEVGNGNGRNATNDLAASLQREDGADALVGGVSRYSDEGISFASSDGSIRFDVRDVSGTQRGTFQQATLGSLGNDVLTTTTGAGVAALTTVGIYVNAGAGNDVVNGSANADFLVGGSGSDQITTGGGRDSILGGAGNDAVNDSVAGVLVNVDAGDGDDVVFSIGGALQATGAAATRDTLAGGNGTDTLASSTANLNAAMPVAAGETATITGFEVIRTDGPAINLTTANVQAGILGVEFDGAAAGTVNFEAGQRFIRVGAELVQIGAAALNAGGTLGGALTAVAAGAAATDALTVSNGRTTGAVNVFAGQAITANGYESLVVNTGAVATAGQTLGTVTVNASAAATPTTLTISGANGLGGAQFMAATNSTGLFTIDASGLAAVPGKAATLDINVAAGATTGANVTGTAGNDNILLNSGTNTLAAGAGDDTLVAGTGKDSITADLGNDLVNMGGNLTAVDVANGGDGRDTLAVTTAISAGNQVGVSNFEILRFDAAAAVDQSFLNFVNNTTFDTVALNGNQNYDLKNAGTALTNLRLDATAADVTFFNQVNLANNTLNLFAGADNSFTVNKLTLGGIDGNANQGTDVLNISQGVANTTAGKNLTVTTLIAHDLDTLNITGAQNTTIGTLTNDLGVARTVTIEAAAATGTVSVGATANTSNVNYVFNGSSSAANTFTGSVGNDTITGGSVVDNLVGGAGRDVISAGAGNDNVTGGANADRVTLGAGNDTVIIGSRDDTRDLVAFANANTTNANIEAILDFVGNGAAAGDSIQFSGVANAFGAALDFDAATTATVVVRNVAAADSFEQLQGLVATAASTNAVAQFMDVTIAGGSLAGRYLVLNDDVAATNFALDTIINLTGITGAVNANDLTFIN